MVSTPLSCGADSNVVAPVSPGSVAYVYQPPVDDGSDVESLVDELWGLRVDDDTESEEEDEEDVDNEDDDREGDHDVGDLPEDMNARCNLIILITTNCLILPILPSCSFLQ